MSKLPLGFLLTLKNSISDVSLWGVIEGLQGRRPCFPRFATFNNIRN